MKVIYKVKLTDEYITIDQPQPGESACYPPGIKCSLRIRKNEQCLGSHDGMCVYGELQTKLITKIKVVDDNQNQLLFPAIF
jgi:hypothetical protein